MISLVTPAQTLIVDEVSIASVANEGVMIKADGKTILIDALFRPVYPEYTNLPQPIEDAMESAQKPFNNIDLVLATHIHGDHFSAAASIQLLVSSPRTHLITTKQAVQEMQKVDANSFNKIADRVQAISPSVGEERLLKVNGISVSVINMPHGKDKMSDIENNGYILTIADKKILHIGDAYVWDKTFKDNNLKHAAIDIAILPYWYVAYQAGLDIIKEHIPAKQLILAHVDIANKQRVVDLVSSQFPNYHLFTDVMERSGKSGKIINEANPSSGK